MAALPLLLELGTAQFQGTSAPLSRADKLLALQLFAILFSLAIH